MLKMISDNSNWCRFLVLGVENCMTSRYQYTVRVELFLYKWIVVVIMWQWECMLLYVVAITVIIEWHRIDKARRFDVMLFDRSSVPHFIYGPHETHARPFPINWKHSIGNMNRQSVELVFRDNLKGSYRTLAVIQLHNYCSASGNPSIAWGHYV